MYVFVCVCVFETDTGNTSDLPLAGSQVVSGSLSLDCARELAGKLASGTQVRVDLGKRGGGSILRPIARSSESERESGQVSSHNGNNNRAMQLRTAKAISVESIMITHLASCLFVCMSLSGQLDRRLLRAWTFEVKVHSAVMQQVAVTGATPSAALLRR